MLGLIGATLRKARTELGLSQAAFARALGFSSEFISFPFNILLRDDALKGPESLDAASQAVLQRFKRYCDDYLRLERLTSRRSIFSDRYKLLQLKSSKKRRGPHKGDT